MRLPWLSLRLLALAAASLAASLTSGCAGAIALAILGITSSGDDGGGSQVVLAPAVEDLRVLAPETTEKLNVEFRIAGKADGRISAAVEYILVERTVEGDLVPSGAPLPATPASGPAPLEDIPSNETVRFVWDAGADLEGRSPFAQVVVTPREDKVEGESTTSKIVHAGSNTPVAIEDVRPALEGRTIIISFDLLDAEWDAVTLEKVEASVDGGELAALPAEILEAASRNFSSAPGPRGSPASFVFSLDDLAEAEPGGDLWLLSEPGFVGEVSFKLSARDFPSEPEPSVGVGAFVLDGNEPPMVEVLPVPPEALNAGVIPVRYRILDRELNAADLRVEVDLGEGKIIEANEFPWFPSEGRKGLGSLDPAVYGNPEQPSHVFLWDAASQVRSGDSVALVLRAADREEGPASRIQVDGFALSGIRRGGRLSDLEFSRYTAWGTGDSNGDGYPDLFLGTSNAIICCRGGRCGLTFEKSVASMGDPEMEVSNPTVGDFDADGYADVVLREADWQDASISKSYCFRGGQDGLTLLGPLYSPRTPGGWTGTADFNRDGFLDLAVQCGRTEELAEEVLCYAGSPGGLRFLRAIPAPSGTLWCLIGDLDGDGFPDFTAAGRWNMASELVYTPGGPEGLVASEKLPLPSWVGCSQAGDFDGDGILDVAVACGTGLVVLQGGVGGLRSSQEFALLSDPDRALMIPGDFNGDGFLDLLVDNTCLSGGPGGLRRCGEWGREGEVATAGDFNGDAVFDLLVFGSGAGSFLRGGPQGLERAGELPLPEASPNGFLSRDFDGDGVHEVLVTYDSLASVTFVPGGKQGPSSAVDLRGVGGALGNSVAEDFDGDGVAEVVFLDSGLSVQLFPGALERAGDVGSGGIPAVLAAGDFDGDGFEDLLSGNDASSGVSVIPGSPRGLGARSALALRAAPSAAVTADFNGDGIADAAVACVGSSTVGFLAGGPEGLALASEIEVGARPSALAAADFDRDGFQDVAAAGAGSDSVTLLLGGAQGLGRSSQIAAGKGPAVLAAGDFDGDGGPDLVVLNMESKSVSFLRGSTEGLSRAGADVILSGRPVAVGVADFDGDGLDDAAVSCAGSKVAFLRGSAAGFTLAGELAAGQGAGAVKCADFDGDAFPDAVVLNQDSENLTYLQGGPDGLQRVGEIEAGETPSEILEGDFDGDGVTDLLAANSSTDVVTFLEGGAGGPIHRYELDAGKSPSLMVKGDFDGDGRADVALGQGSTAIVTLLRQRYLQRHPNALVDPASLAAAPCLLADPRHRPRYRLELPPGCLDATGEPTQVCLAPGPAAELPQKAAFARGKCLLAVTDPVSILRDSTTLLVPATLSLRFREEPADLLEEVLREPARLRVFRRENAGPDQDARLYEETARYEDAGISASEMQLVEFRDGPGLSFPVSRFGSYVVAFEKDR